MAKVSVSLDDDDDGAREIARVQALAAPLPSVSRAKSYALKDAPRVQLSFTSVPKPIKDAFDSEAERQGMGKKEFLYHCLRCAGVNIPSIEEIDGRRR